MRPASTWKAYAALGCVCLFWGTTYLGIKMSLESFPPAMLVALRFLISGGILMAFAVARGAHIPRGAELWRTAWIGFVILGIGNGSLAWSEQLIPSGLASLFITMSPFWLVGIEAAMPGGAPLHAPTIVGMLIGFCGSALLFLPGVSATSANMAMGFAIVQGGMFAWCFGSILQKHAPVRAHPVVTGAVQQLAAGLGALPLALLGDHRIVWSTRGVGALFYLVIFGSIVGYSAYLYALGNLPVSVVSLYPYLNAVVAVGLGWLVYREPFGVREAIAMAIIFAGVGIVKWQSGRRVELARARGAS
jgi:drug/metabolite transporter (DMT)-like permease